jgi:hypothetical protein
MDVEEIEMKLKKAEGAALDLFPMIKHILWLLAHKEPKDRVFALLFCLEQTIKSSEDLTPESVNQQWTEVFNRGFDSEK